MVTLIENPVINSPFEVPQRHFRFDEAGITHDIIPGHRNSTYFIPIAKQKLKTNQTSLDLNTRHRTKENKLINKLRERVGFWRQHQHHHTTAITRRLLDYWTQPERERRLFFCQI